MAVKFEWLDDKKSILCYSFIGHWSWEEAWTTVYEAREQYRQFDHTVDVIVDFSESGMIPGEALTHLRKLVGTRTANLGIVVIAGGNVIVRTIINMGKPLLPVLMAFEIMDTRAEGLAYIYKMRSTV